MIIEQGNKQATDYYAPSINHLRRLNTLHISSHVAVVVVVVVDLE